MLMSDMGQGVGRGVTSDQVIIMAANVIKKQSKPLEVKGLRGRTKSEKRERTVVEQSRLTAGAQKFRKILAREMKARHFGKKFPNALLILLALSKQTKNVLKTVFGDDEEKKDEAKAALIAAYRARKPRAAPSSRSPKKKKPKSPKKKRGLLTSNFPLFMNTPQDAGPFFRRNFVSRNIGIEQNKPWLPIPDPKQTPAWLGGTMRRSRAIITKKTYCFGTFFCQFARCSL